MRQQILGLALALAACSSEVDDRAREAVTPRDDGSPQDPRGTKKDGSVWQNGEAGSLPDASHATPVGDGGSNEANPGNNGAGEGGIICSAIPGASCDFSITLTEEAAYEGPVTVERGDGGAELLVAHTEGGDVRATFDGVAPVVPPGSTLWASFNQHTAHSNPYHSATTSSVRVQSSEHGALLAEVREGYASAGSTTFLDANVDVSVLCTLEDYSNSHTGSPCLTTEYYVVTVHGDSDLTLTPTSEGRVTIHGVEYDVWLLQATNESLAPSSSLCIADWGPHPGFRISGRAVRYTDALQAAAHDAGSDH